MPPSAFLSKRNIENENCSIIAFYCIQFIECFSQQSSFRALTQDQLNNPDSEDWLMWRGGHENWGYSPLDQINRDNVSDIRMVWSYAIGPGGDGSMGMQVEPTVYDGVLYIRHPNGRYTAHDARNGDLIWEYSPPIRGISRRWRRSHPLPRQRRFHLQR